MPCTVYGLAYETADALGDCVGDAFFLLEGAWDGHVFTETGSARFRVAS